ncbi:glycosyltransferase family 32 protein [Mucilaginibacter sp. UYCu711]|uniref:glycosyltransferase family 32 protein n=1 Tax=Mucilaginibacter sp. UYCu711 TaxID=3156339 RepID=UPI003D23F235
MTPIPTIIHQTWKNANLPSPLDSLSETWKHFHPDWDHILWTDEMNREFIKDHYPHFLAKYDQYPSNIQRVDVFRYCVLNTMGGLYVDLDFECLENIEPLLNKQACVIGKEPQYHAERYSKNMILCNAFMASTPNNKFMQFVLNKIISHSKIEVNSPTDVLNSTGPFILTDGYNEYNEKSEVTILESSDVYPINMFETKYILDNTISDEMQLRIDKAYAVHYFFGTW